MFGKVMQDAELCKELLQRILPDLDIDHIEFDLFGLGRHLYTFENICKEDNSVFLKDGGVKRFLNADIDNINSSQNDVSKELKAFLDYVAGRESEDGFVQRLEEAVKQARKNRKWRHEYMTLLNNKIFDRNLIMNIIFLFIFL